MKYDLKITIDITKKIYVDSDNRRGKISFPSANMHETIGRAVGFIRKYKSDNSLVNELLGGGYAVELVLNLTPDTLESRTVVALRLASSVIGFDVRFAAYGKELLLNGSKKLSDV